MYRSDLTPAERTKLIDLQNEISSDIQTLSTRESEEKTCSARHTGLLIEVGCLKSNLTTLERELERQKNDGALDLSSRSSYRGSFQKIIIARQAIKFKIKSIG